MLGRSEKAPATVQQLAPYNRVRASRRTGSTFFQYGCEVLNQWRVGW